MKELTINYGGETLTFQKSQTLYAVKKKKTAATRGLESESTEQKTMGDFTLVEVEAEDTSKSISKNVESALDEARENADVSVGTHVYYVGETKEPLVPDGTIYVVFSEHSDKKVHFDLMRKHQLNVVEKIGDHEYWTRITEKSINPLKVAAELQEESTIEIAEPDFIRNIVEYSFQPPNDSLFRDQWHLENEGPSRYYYLGGTGGGIFAPSKFTKGADGKIVAAWKHLDTIGMPPLGRKEIIVAVIDSGFDIDHPDLYGDGNKIVAPYNFKEGSTNPRPLKIQDLPAWYHERQKDEGHGTPCAGVAVGDANGSGTVGSCPNARLMPIKALHSGNEKDIVSWFEHAVNNGADIISCSWGLGEGSKISNYLKDKLKEFATKGRDGKGCIICFAAGNTDPNRTVKVSGLAADPHVICVTSSTSGDKVSTYSFQGKEVCVAAPSNGEGGASITICSVGREYTWRPHTVFIDSAKSYTASFGGTSSACPLVAGICGLILTANAQLTARQVKNILQETADKIEDSVSDPNGYVNGHSLRFGHGRVNALKAVQMAEKENVDSEEVVVPAPVSIPTPEDEYKMATVIDIVEDDPLSVRWQPKSNNNDNISRTLKNGTRIKVKIPKEGNWYQLAPEYVYGRYVKIDGSKPQPHLLDPKDYFFELPSEGRPAMEDSTITEEYYPGIQATWPNCTSNRSDENLNHITTLVIHATVGANSTGAVSVMKAGDASFHWLIPDEDEPAHGQLVWKCVDENKKAWHAGYSSHSKIEAKRGFNDISLGIEVVNRQDDVDSFSDWQLEMTAQIARYCWAKYPNLKYIVSHASVDTKGKSDPGILFNWEQFIGLVLNGTSLSRSLTEKSFSEEKIRSMATPVEDIEVDEEALKGTCWYEDGHVHTEDGKLLKEEGHANESKIYVLFVAINEYKHITNLNGCINDIENVQAYLQESAQAQNRILEVETLKNSQATKQNIVETFRRHLEQATKNDICLFYFSGHGGQEDAHAIFQDFNEEPGRKLEVLACHDSRLSNPSTFLADKELRYLFHQLYEKTQAEIISIFDCCHSGTNTKSGAVARTFRRDADIPSRTWEGFIFAKDITEQMAKSANNLEEILPEGKHLQLAACEDKQYAYETRTGKREGVFTSNMVQLLRQARGDISYQDLISVLRLKIQGSHKQTPQIGYSEGNQEFIYRSFLGGITRHQTGTANLVFNASQNAWLIDMGAIHGISPNNKNLKIELLDDAQNSIVQAQVKDIQVDQTTIGFEADQAPNPDHAHIVKVSGLIVQALNIHCSGDAEGIQVFKGYVNNAENHIDYFTLTEENNSLVDYWVKASNGIYSICSPDNHQPVTATVEGYDETGAAQIAAYLKRMARWTAVKNLENPSSNIQPLPPFDIEIFVKQTDNTEKKVDLVGSTAHIEYTTSTGLGEKPTKVEVRIRLRNNTPIDYYCALLYLAQDFTVQPALNPAIAELPAGETVYAASGQFIPDIQSPFIKIFNWEAETHYLKLIISTQTFDVQKFTEKELPTPDTTGKHATKTGWIITKKLGFDGLYAHDWNTQLVELSMLNPYYVQEDETVHANPS